MSKDRPSDEELADRLDGMFAYDTGAVDSGIAYDEYDRVVCSNALRRRCVGQEEFPRKFLSEFVRDKFLTDEAIKQGYGIEEVKEFVGWLRHRMGIYI